MKRPDPCQFRTAADWLRCYDAESAEHKDCVAVADWLDGQADAAEIRAEAAFYNVPVSLLRAKLKGIT